VKVRTRFVPTRIRVAYDVSFVYGLIDFKSVYGASVAIPQGCEYHPHCGDWSAQQWLPKGK
jgi:hypothetical protein